MFPALPSRLHNTLLRLGLDILPALSGIVPGLDFGLVGVGLDVFPGLGAGGGGLCIPLVWVGDDVLPLFLLVVLIGVGGECPELVVPGLDLVGLGLDVLP